MLTSKIIDKWRPLLEDVPKVIHLGQWVGFYCDGVDDPAFVLRWSEDFIPSTMHQHHLSLPLTVKCFRVGAPSRCLSEWLHYTGDFHGFSINLKSITPQGGQRRDRRKSFSFTASWPHLVGTLDWW